MNMYIYINEEGYVMAILPEYDDAFPGVHITRRFSATFLAACLIRQSEQLVDTVAVGMKYDADTDSFYEAPVVPLPPDPAPEPEPEPTPEPEPEPEPGQPTWTERIETLERENKTLQAQLEASIQSNQMLEDCLVEMAGVVYA